MQKIIKNIAKIAFIAAILSPFNGAQAASPISCPLTAGSDSYIVNFPSTVLVSNIGTAFATEVSVNANLPAGNYDITAVTWDDHSGHGGQNQPKEQVFFQFYKADGSHNGITGNTNDIPENVDSVTTVLGNNMSIASAITKITAKHSHRGQDSRYQSVYPICIKMSRTDVPPVIPPTPTDFSVSCSVSDRNVETDEDVTFTATVTGGNTPFTYRWSGDVSGSGRSITESFDDEGSYRTNVRVTDEDGIIRSADCATVVVGDEEENEELEVSCEVSDSSIEEGDDVKISVDIDGGEGPYEIEWDGDTDEVDDFDDDAKSQRVEFEDSGRYEFEVTVEDENGDEESDTCVVRVSDDNNSVATTDGELAGLSSVYLSQVPYTGVEDTAKVFGFIALIAVWSAAIAYYLLKNKTRAIVKSKIQAFKEANLAKKQVRS